MSRFEEVVNEAIDHVVLERVPARRGPRGPHRRARPRAPGRPARRGHASPPATPRPSPPPSRASPPRRSTPLFGTAVASERGTRTLTGVEAQGMTACPCAQGLVEDGARERARRARLQRPTRSTECRDRPPRDPQPARHRHASTSAAPRAPPSTSTPATSCAIVEQSMSCEIYELMKRADERTVVEKAHANPRFVEDCVREMIRQVAERLPRPRPRRLRAWPARRTSRRSTATTSSPSATA